jgi:hypothetical protein
MRTKSQSSLSLNAATSESKGELPSKCKEIHNSIEENEKGEIVLPCFQNLSSGLYTLDEGWEFQVFEDKRYDAWRRVMIEVLMEQIDYPLIVPPELEFLLSLID